MIRWNPLLKLSMNSFWLSSNQPFSDDPMKSVDETVKSDSGATSIDTELAERKGFTSEIFKIELNGIPKFFGANQACSVVTTFMKSKWNILTNLNFLQLRKFCMLNFLYKFVKRL